MLPWIKKALIVAALIGVLTATIVTAVLVSSNDDSDRGNDSDNDSSAARFWSSDRGNDRDSDDSSDTSSSSTLEESANPPGEFCVADSGCSKPAQWVVSLPVPEIIDGTNGGMTTITASKGCQQVFHTSDGAACGSPTEIWGYNGQWPGPTIVAQKGVPFDIQHVNEIGLDYQLLPIRTSVHHHGLHNVAAHDGHAKPDSVTDNAFALDAAGLMSQGDNFTYELENDQEPGTHWYHDHTLHETGRQVAMGLAGFYIINPNNETIYNQVKTLPSGEYDVALALQDRLFTPWNQIRYPMSHEELLVSRTLVREGYFGDYMIVNGVHAPYMETKRGWYRLRLLNGCSARELDLQVQTSDGNVLSDILFQIGTEGGFIAAPTRRSSIPMVPGERYDILLDFTGASVGDKFYLRNLNDQRPILPEIMEFRVVAGETPSFSLPTSLVEYSWPTNPTVTRSMRLGDDDDTNAWLIEKTHFDPNVANFHVRKGTTERWEFVARWSNHPHPMHIHLVQFHVDGTTPGSLTDGWKDIVRVPENGRASVTAVFDGEPGIYMFHCHNLEHEDHDMMLQFAICDDSEEYPCDEALLNRFVE